MEAQKPFLVARLHELMDKAGGGRKSDRHAALAGGKTESQGDMALAGAARDSVTMPGVRRSRCESSILFILGPENWCRSSTASGSPVRIIWLWFSRTARSL